MKFGEVAQGIAKRLQHDGWPAVVKGLAGNKSIAIKLDNIKTEIAIDFPGQTLGDLRIPGSCRPRFRQIVAQHSELKSPGIPI